MKLRLAPVTERYVAAFAHATPHAILLTGPTGAGLRTLAHHIAAQNGRLLTTVTPESKSSALASIPVERIRQLYVETRSRLDGTNFVIIDDADTMNHAAQNALLKLLEEPNQSICFILTSHSPDKLLPTIRSRVQSFAVPPIGLLESKRLLTALGVKDALAEQRLLYVAEGLPAELSRLAASESDFKALLERVQQAKQLVEGSAYQRAALCVGFSGDRRDAMRLIDMAVLLLRRSLTAASDRGTVAMIDRMLVASDAIRANGNVKLHLTAAVLQ